MVVHEESILQAKKASDQNPDDWPQFNLKQAKVTSLKTGEIVSLLSAHADNPLSVVGKLDTVDDDLSHLVRDRNYKDKSIILDRVTTYAFAEYDDGTIGFWAAGKAGWFEIQSPAPSFEAVYNKMNEAASIFYILADKLRRAFKRAPTLSAKDLNKYARRVFQTYFVQRKDPAYPADVDEVQAIFHEHKDFLMTSMLEGQEGLDWTQTPMLNYYKSKFPDEYATIEARVLRPIGMAQVTSEAYPKDGRDGSRKRKSQSPHESLGETKKQKRKAAQQAESRIQLLPKGPLPKTPHSRDNHEAPSSDEDDGGDINIVGRKQKSILQPSGSKYSRKAAARRRGLAQATGSQSDDDGQNNERSPITVLRNARDLENLTNPPTSHSSPDAIRSPKFLPRRYLELKVVEYNLPSTKPQGPGDLWTCTFEGCFYRVHEASTAEGKTRTREHFKTHASQAQEKIDLVLNESRPYLPVNNLVRRLQAFAPSPGTEPGPESLERKFSAPIRRRY